MRRTKTGHGIEEIEGIKEQLKFALRLTERARLLKLLDDALVAADAEPSADRDAQAPA